MGNLQMATLIVGLIGTLIAAVVIYRECFPQSGKRKKNKHALANGRTGTGAGGSVTRFAEAAITTPYLLVTKGTADNEVVVCALDDLPIGTVQDTAAIDEEVSVLLLGGGVGSHPMVASKAIDVHEPVYTVAGGKVSDVGATDSRCVGVALTAAAVANDVIDVAPIYTIVQES